MLVSVSNETCNGRDWIENRLGTVHFYQQGVKEAIRKKKWLGMEGSNLRFLIQSQASYHWTNPQQSGCGADNILIMWAMGTILL